VHELRRHTAREAVAGQDRRHVGDHHAERRAPHHAEEIVKARGEGDRTGRNEKSLRHVEWIPRAENERATTHDTPGPDAARLSKAK
jgi:hypothetical protein